MESFINFLLWQDVKKVLDEKNDIRKYLRSREESNKGDKVGNICCNVLWLQSRLGYKWQKRTKDILWLVTFDGANTKAKLNIAELLRTKFPEISDEGVKYFMQRDIAHCTELHCVVMTVWRWLSTSINHYNHFPTCHSAFTIRKLRTEFMIQQSRFCTP